MAEFPALPLYTDAYLGDTRHLTAAQHGAYLLLLITAWRTKDCALPDDDNKLSKWSSMDMRTWLKTKPIILSETLRWTLGQDNQWRQARLSDERKRAEYVRGCQVRAGLASALKRKETQSRHVITDVPTERQPPSPSPIPSNEGNNPPTPLVGGDWKTQKGKSYKIGILGFTFVKKRFNYSLSDAESDLLSFTASERGSRPTQPIQRGFNATNNRRTFCRLLERISASNRKKRRIPRLCKSH